MDSNIVISNKNLCMHGLKQIVCMDPSWETTPDRETKLFQKGGLTFVIDVGMYSEGQRLNIF